jgi:hypothetical protein
MRYGHPAMMLFLLRWKGGWAGAYGKLGEVEKQASRSLKKKKILVRGGLV